MSYKVCRGVGRWVATLAALALPIVAGAADRVVPAAEEFVKPPVFGAIEFSPDGSRFAALVERQGKMIVAVVEHETRKARTFAHQRDLDAVAVRWLSNDLLVVRNVRMGTSQFDLNRGDVENSYISVDGKSPAAWWNANGGGPRRVPGSVSDVVTRRLNLVAAQELELVDAAEGSIKRRLTGDPPGTRVRDWILDSKLVPRAGTGYDIDSREVEIWWRPQEQAPWVKAFKYAPATQRGFVPVAMDNNDNLLVLSNMANGRTALHRFDPVTGRPGELLVGHPNFDIDAGDLIYSDESWAPVGVAVDAEKAQTIWFDDARMQVQRRVDAALPERINNLRFLPNRKVLVFSHGDVDPGTYYFFDEAENRLTEWLRVRPWMRPEQLSRMQVVHYSARDGQELFGYFTAPTNAAAQAAPTIVWVHGGPADRDHWGFNPDVQFLASRGFAVFQPGFRGSRGMGDRFETAGFKQWGRLMQDDITDGVRALIKQGLVDERRVCIGGASYGGYAALMGLVRQPEMFRCAIDEVGPTDLLTWTASPVADFMQSSASYRDGEVRDSLRRRIGNADDPAERRDLEEASPRRQAARIKAPVLLMYGSSDRRVPLDQGTAMRDALHAAGSSVEWKSYSGEGHGLWDRGNQLDRLKRIEAFLVKHLSPAN